MQNRIPQQVATRHEPVGQRPTPSKSGPAPGRLAQLAVPRVGGATAAVQHRLDRLLEGSPRLHAQRQLMAIAQQGNRAAVTQAAALAHSVNASGAAQSNRVVQRMVTREGKEISDGGQYFIETSRRQSLFVAKTATSPVPAKHFKPSGETISFDPFYEEHMAYLQGPVADRSRNYEGYVPAAPFGKDGDKPNDCAMYANALRCGKDTWTNFKPGVNGLDYRPVADYHPDGINDADKDPDIRAKVGEMYHIKWEGDKPKAELANHHAATVVATDGADQVTSEANAAVAMAIPEFRMYGTGKTSFYEQNADYFTQPSGLKPYMAIAAKGT